MSIKPNNATILACAAILGFASSAVNAQSATKPSNIATDINSPAADAPTIDPVAWKIFPVTNPGAPGLILPNANPQLAAPDANGQTLLISSDAPAATPVAVPAKAPAASQTNASVPASTQDLIMDLNRHPGGINHAGKSAQSIGTVSVPLPTAAWTGLTGLLGLGAIAYGKKIIKLITQ